MKKNTFLLMVLIGASFLFGANLHAQKTITLTIAYENAPKNTQVYELSSFNLGIYRYDESSMKDSTYTPVEPAVSIIFKKELDNNFLKMMSDPKSVFRCFITATDTDSKRPPKTDYEFGGVKITGADLSQFVEDSYTRGGSATLTIRTLKINGIEIKVFPEKK
jgi:hypothetical protein